MSRRRRGRWKRGARCSRGSCGPVRRPQPRARSLAVKDVIDRVAEQQGSEVLAFETTLKLAEAMELVASDEGLVAGSWSRCGSPTEEPPDLR